MKGVVRIAPPSQTASAWPVAWGHLWGRGFANRSRNAEATRYVKLKRISPSPPEYIGIERKVKSYT